MYKLNYYSKITEGTGGTSNKEQEYECLGMSEFFRLRKNALHYLYEIVQNEYREQGYATETEAGCLHCYKSKKTAEGKREVTELLIKVEK